MTDHFSFVSALVTANIQADVKHLLFQNLPSSLPDPSNLPPGLSSPNNLDIIDQPTNYDLNSH